MIQFLRKFAINAENFFLFVENFNYSFFPLVSYNFKKQFFFNFCADCAENFISLQNFYFNFKNIKEN